MHLLIHRDISVAVIQIISARISQAILLQRLRYILHSWLYKHFKKLSLYTTMWHMEGRKMVFHLLNQKGKLIKLSLSCTSNWVWTDFRSSQISSPWGVSSDLSWKLGRMHLGCSNFFYFFKNSVRTKFFADYKLDHWARFGVSTQRFHFSSLSCSLSLKLLHLYEEYCQNFVQM